MKRFYEVNGILRQTATVAGQPTGTAPAGDINNTAPRPEPAVEWTDGDLPDQSFDRRTMLPGIRTFKLPDNLAQLWADTAVEDKRKVLANGQPNPTFGQKVARKMLKMTKNAPLVVVGGPDDGQPLTWNPSSAPRNRGKADDPKTPWISELAYLLDVGLQGHLPVAQRVRPTGIDALVAEINKYAGKTVRLETGLSAQCRADKIRYIVVETADADGRPTIHVQQDPSGTKGCGARYYTKDFKNPAGGQVDPATGQPQPMYDLEIPCTNQVVDQATGQPRVCDSALRGFESVDRILPPVGV